MAICVAIAATIIGSAFGPAAAVDGKHVNGRGVSVQWRYGRLDWGPACCECGEGRWVGSIDLFTIQNGRVVATDTIYNRTQGVAYYPAFDFSGTKVAFYRAGSAPGAGTSCVSINSGKNRISVIDVDGRNLTDLCDLPMLAGRSAIDNLPGEGGLDWPAGDWIYYILPRVVTSQWFANNCEIWKVNYRTHENVKVCKITNNAGTDFHCWYFRRFSTTLAADRMCLQTMYQYGCDQSGAPDILGEALLPPPNCNLQAPEARVYDAGGGCNASVSASGNYVAGWNASHALMWISRVAWPSARGALYTFTMHIDSVKKWGGLTDDSIGSDAELIRWAANSDKWVLQQVGWYGHASEISSGSNQLAGNPFDRAGIRLSWNPKIAPDPNVAGSGVITYGNCAGDMWIDGGAANLGKWEDTAGVWHEFPGYVPPDRTASVALRGQALSQRTASVDAAGTIRIRLASPHRAEVRILDMQGQSLYSSMATGSLTIPAGTLKPGMYLVCTRIGGEQAATRLTISR
jgi:hypothetical protein